MNDLAIAIPRAHPGFEGELRTAASLRRSLSSATETEASSRSTYDAALVLLASVETPHNVDRISRLLGLSREFVARCGRRLCDNGVWAAGRVICSWTDPAPGERAFWADVAVAEGRLCRRIEESGSLQWAAPGVWHKNYSLVDQRPNLDTSVSYEVPSLPANVQGDEVGSPAPVSEERDADSLILEDEAGGSAMPVAAAPFELIWLQEHEQRTDDVTPAEVPAGAFAIIGSASSGEWLIGRRHAPPNLSGMPTELYPDAVWLG